MRIEINGQEYSVPDEKMEELLGGFHMRGVQEYEAQGLELQLLASAVARWILAKLEKGLRLKLGRERASEICRPAKKADPVVHLSQFMADRAREALSHATLTIKTDEQYRATDFKLSFAAESEAGRSLATDGDERFWEDNRAEVS